MFLSPIIMHHPCQLLEWKATYVVKEEERPVFVTKVSLASVARVPYHLHLNALPRVYKS